MVTGGNVEVFVYAEAPWNQPLPTDDCIAVPLGWRRTFVYLFLDVNRGHIKIGFSANPVWRRAAVAAKECPWGSRSVITLLSWIPGSRRDERRLHAEFQEERERGEWFYPSDRLRGAVAALAFSHFATGDLNHDERWTHWGYRSF